MYNKEYHTLISQIYKDHQKHWASQRELMKGYSAMYSLDFWRDLGRTSNDMIQTSDARNFIEGYLSSLFSKAPAVSVQEDIQATKANPQLAELLINRFLEDQELTITNGCRLALIFPSSFFKVSYKDDNTVSLLDRFFLDIKKPWEIIVDSTATAWEHQRWIGSIEHITVAKASELYGRKEWTSTATTIDYLNVTEDLSPFGSRHSNTNDTNVPEEYKYITIVDFYDRQGQKRIVWTPNLKDEGGILRTEAIPLINGKPLVAIIPLYLNSNPEKPLEGFSFMKTIYDPIKEKNLLRTHLASQIRRDSRQYLYEEGKLDEEAVSQLVQGKDMTFIPVHGEPAGAILPVPNIPINTDHQYYNNLIETDLQRSNMMASFTRGQSTNVTATEIAALQQYTASEVGKLARIRDTAIEEIATIFISVLSPFIEDEDAITVTLNGSPKIINTSDLEGKLKIIAVDQGTLPITKMAKKQELVNLAPTLISLGVDKTKILEAIVDLFELPPIFKEIAKPEMPTGQPGLPMLPSPDGSVQ